MKLTEALIQRGLRQAMCEKHTVEHAVARAADTDGTGFIFDMFDYELANHEYSYTYDPEPALNTLGLTLEDVEAGPIKVVLLMDLLNVCRCLKEDCLNIGEAMLDERGNEAAYRGHAAAQPHDRTPEKSKRFSNRLSHLAPPLLCAVIS